MVYRRVTIHGWLEVDPRPSGGRPDQGLPGYGHPDQGLPGYGHPDQGLPGYGHPDQGLPGYGHPDQGLPGYGHPSHGLPIAPVRPDNGLPGLPVYPSQGPILPALPGRPIPVPRVPVVQAIALPEGETLPTGAPTKPGLVCIVVDPSTKTKALGWLQGESDLPVAAPKGDAPAPGGHWVAVEVYPQAQPKKCPDGGEGVGKVGFAWVSEVKPDWGPVPVPEPK